MNVPTFCFGFEENSINYSFQANEVMLIGSIGVGLFVLIVVWILALLVFVFGIKFQNNVAWVSLSLATSLTIIITLIPVDKTNKVITSTNNLDGDSLYIYQAFLLVFLFLSALLGFIFFFILHCIEPIHPKAVKLFNGEL